MEKFFKRYQMVLWILFIVLLIPLLAATVYNRPSVDDLIQPVKEHNAYLSGGNVLAADWNDMLAAYQNWSGLYFHMLLARIPPMVFDYTLAWIHPIFFLLFLAGSVFLFIRTLGRVLSVRRLYMNHIALLLVIEFLLFMPATDQGIYWFTGAVAYTFAFSLALCVYALFLSWVFLKGKPAGQTIKLIGVCAGGFLLAGTNFSTNTVSLVLFVLLAAYALWKKKTSWLVLLPVGVYLAGFVLSMAAPGNAARYTVDGYTGETSYVETFLITFRDSFGYILEQRTLFLFSLLFLPVLVTVAQEKSWNCGHPVWALLLSFGVFAAGFIAPVHARRFLGDPRLINVQFFMLSLLVVFNLLYLIRFFRGRFKHSEKPPENQKKFWTRFVLGAGMVVIAATLVTVQFHPFALNSQIPSLRAAARLRDGTLKTYAEEYDALVALAMSRPDADIVLTAMPYSDFFYPLALDSNETYWQNIAFTQYYAGKSIVYIPPEEE